MRRSQAISAASDVFSLFDNLLCLAQYSSYFIKCLSECKYQSIHWKSVKQRQSALDVLLKTTIQICPVVPHLQAPPSTLPCQLLPNPRSNIILILTIRQHGWRPMKYRQLKQNREADRGNVIGGAKQPRARQVLSHCLTRMVPQHLQWIGQLCLGLQSTWGHQGNKTSQQPNIRITHKQLDINVNFHFLQRNMVIFSNNKTLEKEFMSSP